jgi:hypothetical protein
MAKAKTEPRTFAKADLDFRFGANLPKKPRAKGTKTKTGKGRRRGSPFGS